VVRRGCAFVALLFAALFALYFFVFTRYFEWPGNLFAAGLGALFAAVGLGAIANLVWAWRDTAAFRRAERRAPLVDGALTVLAGPIRPLGAPLTSPLGGRPCVAYDYEVVPPVVASGGDAPPPARADLAGFAMAASVIETPVVAVRVLGFPLLDQFPKASPSGPEAVARARQYAAATPFEAVHGLGAFQMVSALDDALVDADGAVRKDFRLNADEIPFEQRRLGERRVDVGQEVCALGRYDAEKRALVPGSASPNRLWPGSPATVRRRIVAAVRTQALLGLMFFAVSHAMLGGAFYLSETRYARQSESSQASAIRIAVQDSDVAALERVVRQGANPNARDVFGDPVLLDVRDPTMVAALVRLGADVDVRHREDGDTPLIRAARMGLVDVVRVLLAAHADTNAKTTRDETALSEAVRGGHEDVVALLRAAAAAGDLPVERSTR
jgi:Ankyrin repeats (3 copies)